MTTRPLRALALTALPAAAAAHEGHGFFGPHWHATDAWGFVAVALLVAVIWFSRRK